MRARQFALLFCSLLIMAAQPSRSQSAAHLSVTPDDLLILANDFYELGIRKSNGSLAYIRDKQTEQNVSEGSRGECLWGAVFEQPGEATEYTGGCSYSDTGANHFSYVWSQETGSLELTYTPAAGSNALYVRVEITPSDAHWFDMQLAVENRWGRELDQVLFASDLWFLEPDINEVLLPILPGVLLTRDFFSLDIPCSGDEQDRCYETDYPGWPGVFADFMSLQLDTGSLAVYSIPPADKIVPAHLGIVHDDEYDRNPYLGSTARAFLSHTFKTKLPPGAWWISPIVRVQVGLSHKDAVLALRRDSGIEAFPDLQEKLGTKYAQFVRSPLYKIDAEQVGRPFNAYVDQVLPQIPYPGILHTVAYWEGGFDENYPDFLPPSSEYGSQTEMVAMFRAAQGRGHLMMPYINPTWWDNESPTLQNLPTSVNLSSLVALDESGKLRGEWYGTHFGYIMSPRAAFVQQRLGTLMQQMTSDVPSDAIYEDQVGARGAVYDYNPSLGSPAGYSTAWLEHTRQYQGEILTTEMGIDRLAVSETGFHGSIGLLKAGGETTRLWGDAWRTFPVAPLLLRDKVLLYHATEARGSTRDKEMLSENLAYGYMLSFDYGALKNDPDAMAWLPVVGAFQSRVLSAFAAVPMTDYRWIAADVSRSEFRETVIVANRNQTAPYAYGSHTLSHGGVLVQRPGLTAGVLTAYNGASLSAGDHYLIVETMADHITVRQPMGADTSIRLGRLSAWPANVPLVAQGYGYDGKVLGVLPLQPDGTAVRLSYTGSIGGVKVAWVTIGEADLLTATPTATRRPSDPTATPTATRRPDHPTVTPTATRRPGDPTATPMPSSNSLMLPLIMH